MSQHRCCASTTRGCIGCLATSHGLVPRPVRSLRPDPPQRRKPAAKGPSAADQDDEQTQAFVREDDAEPTQVYVRPDDDESTQAVAGYDDFGIVLDRFSRVSSAR